MLVVGITYEFSVENDILFNMTSYYSRSGSLDSPPPSVDQDTIVKDTNKYF